MFLRLDLHTASVCAHHPSIPWAARCLDEYGDEKLLVTSNHYVYYHHSSWSFYQEIVINIVAIMQWKARSEIPSNGVYYWTEEEHKQICEKVLHFILFSISHFLHKKKTSDKKAKTKWSSPVYNNFHHCFIIISKGKVHFYMG